MKGWYRISKRAVWHFWFPWEANEMVLMPACRRGLGLTRPKNSNVRILKAKDELPLDAKLCRGCDGSKEAAC